jgi:hypothetical protein
MKEGTNTDQLPSVALLFLPLKNAASLHLPLPL